MQARGTWQLVRLALRRDRVKLAVWCVVILVLVAIMMPALYEAYGSESDRIAIAAMMNESAATKALGFMDNASMGALLMVELYLFVAVLVAFMSTTLVVRHTRHNEESGSAEVLLSAPVGRHAPVFAAVVVAFSVNGALALAMAGLLLPYADLPSASVWGLAAVTMVIGWVFTLVGALAAQLSSTARGAYGVAAMVIGVLFLVRSVGDVLGRHTGELFESTWPSWLSPFGWGQQLHLFTDTVQWWVFGLFAGCIAILACGVYVLLRVRDVGEGVLRLRRGASRANALLQTPAGLVWRLQRTLWAWWALVMVVCGVLYGALTDEFGNLLDASVETMQQYVAMFASEADMIDAYLGSMILLNVLFVMAYTVQALLRFRHEETGGRMEVLLATPVARLRWLLLYVCGTFLGSALLLVLFGGAMGAAYAATSTVAIDEVVRLAGAALSYWPAVALIGAVVATAQAAAPRYSAVVGWGVFGWVVVVAQLGQLLQFPQWLMNSSPLTHVAVVPAESLEGTPLIVMLIISSILVSIGCVAYRRRDSGQ